MTLLTELYSKNLLNQPPPYVLNNTQYLTIMGSEAYGVKSDSSDIDIYGFCIPYKDIVFPHLSGEILGFGRQKKRFEQYQNHGIIDKENNKKYDIVIYNIIKYFHLTMECNPNMIDSLFTPQRCVLYANQLTNLVRENRKLFLSKLCLAKFKGYAYSQLHKLKNKSIIEYVNLCEKLNIPETTSITEIEDEIMGKKTLNIYNGNNKEDLFTLQKLAKKIYQNGNITKRLDSIKKYRYDTKFAYNIVRLLNECEQILLEEDIDLERNREQLKSIRRGDWSIKQINDYFNIKEKNIENIYAKSSLRIKPDENFIKQLLLKCLEMHFGSIDNCIKVNKINNLVNDIENVLAKYRK